MDKKGSKELLKSVREQISAQKPNLTKNIASVGKQGIK
jgi:hypothetical protein